MSKQITKEKVKAKVNLKKLDVACPQCDHPIDGSNININSTLAKCSHCNAILFMEDDEFFGRRKRNRPEMMIPIGTEVLHLPSSLDIRTKWNKARSKGSTWFLLLFAVMWNIIILPTAVTMLTTGQIGGLIAMSAHLTVGIGLIYYLLGVYLNYTDIYVTDEDITIETRPLKNPFTKNRVIKTKDIKQLYVSRYVSSTTNGIANYAYALYAIDQSDRRNLLLKGMNKESQLYIEQEIEQFLEIEDIRISGEVIDES